MMVQHLLAHRLRVFGSAFALVAGLAANSQADTNITLAWDPSSDPSVIGYKLYQGTNSQSYATNSILGNVTSAKVQNLHPGTTYYFAVTAYNSNDLESTFSGQIQYTASANSLDPQLSITRNLSGQSVLTATASPGATYNIEISSNLLSWSWLAVVTADPAGRIQYVDTTSSLTTIRFYRLTQSPGQAPRAVLSIAKNASGQVVLSATGAPGTNYSVEVTTNLRTWSRLTNVTANTSGKLQYIDPVATAPNGLRFYRLRQ
jgi:hypothetical protein